MNGKNERLPIADRLRLKTKILPSGCHEWTGGRSKAGYGVISYLGKHDYVHRIVLRLTMGDLPKGLHVCHKCDNPSCVNPEQLFLGTNAENQWDKFRKNRHARGTMFSRNSRLTEDAVAYIRSSDETGRALAKKFGVSEGTLSAARNGHTWKHVHQPPPGEIRTTSSVSLV